MSDGRYCSIKRKDKGTGRKRGIIFSTISNGTIFDAANPENVLVMVNSTKVCGVWG